MLKMSSYENSEIWRDIRKKEAKVEAYHEHLKAKEKLLKFDDELTQKKELAFEKYAKNLSIKKEQFDQETLQMELRLMLSRKLKIVG